MLRKLLLLCQNLKQTAMKNPSMGVDPSTGIDHLSHQLPFEIHLLIIGKLDYVDFTRFSAVCKARRSIASAARKSPFFRLQQVPWLIYAHELPKLFGLNDSLRFCGSSQDWLLLSQSCPARSNNGEKNFLLNPITRQRISLPKNPKFVLEVGVILPPSRDGITVVAYFQSNDVYFRECYKWRSRNKRYWIKRHWDIGSPSISDMIYHKGNIYAAHKYSPDGITIINMSSYRPSCSWQKTMFLNNELIRPNFRHLVECDGELLVVVGYCLLCSRWEETVDVSVFKCINPINSRFCWEKVESVGEKYALLLGKGNSMAIDVSNNTSFSFRANCVYFLEKGQGIRIFNLGNRGFEI